MRYDNNFYNGGNFCVKYRDAIEQRYGHFGKKKRKCFRDDFDNKFGVLDEKGEPTIRILESEKKWWLGTQVPSLANLMNICEVLNCDIDYFLTDQDELRKEIASAAEVTGLKQKSIETLHNFADEYTCFDRLNLQCIDFLLSEDGKELLPLLCSLIYVIEPYEVELIEEIIHNNNPELYTDEQLTDEQNAAYEYIAEILHERGASNFFEFGGNLYMPSNTLNPFSDTGVISFELNQELTKIREAEKAKRSKYKGIVNMLLEPMTGGFLQEATLKSFEGSRMKRLIKEKRQYLQDYSGKIELEVYVPSKMIPEYLKNDPLFGEKQPSFLDQE